MEYVSQITIEVNLGFPEIRLKYKCLSRTSSAGIFLHFRIILLTLYDCRREFPPGSKQTMNHLNG